MWLRRRLVVLCLTGLAAACTGGDTEDGTDSASGSLPATADLDGSSMPGGTIQASGTTEGSTASSDATTDPSSTAGSSSTSDPSASTTSAPSTGTTSTVGRERFETLPPGSPLPDGERCAELVQAEPTSERRPGNLAMNTTVVEVDVDIDGADAFWNERLAPRITGDFVGTTEQILRWGACKWGFDEDITFARAVTESSWRSTTEGDSSGDPATCALIGLDAPCAQSYGLLQVKGTVHEGTHPATTRSSAFGVDYAMAWLRACYEGSFVWLHRDGGVPYEAGEELGCVGAWFSGQWWDQAANDYVGEVRFHLDRRTWESYGS